MGTKLSLERVQAELMVVKLFIDVTYVIHLTIDRQTTLEMFKGKGSIVEL
jgi:hypothetical protein